MEGRQPVRARVVFPDSYPYLRPEAYAEERIARHQNPVAGNLCLLDVYTGAWRVTDTLAWLLTVQLRALFRLVEAKDEAAMRAAEIPQGEPFSTWFNCRPGSVVLIPDQALRLDDGVAQGLFALSVFPKDGLEDIQLRAALLEVVDAKDRRIAFADPALQDWAERGGGRPLLGRWKRFHREPNLFDVNVLFSEVQGSRPEEFERQIHDRHLAVSAAVFQEEVTQGEYEDVWLFSAREFDGRDWPAFFVRGDRYSAVDLSPRIPELAPLRGAKVALVGTGAIGSEIARDLARGQVGELRILDGGGVEAGNTVRWAYGLPAAQHSKASWLVHQLNRDYPLVTVRGFAIRLGQAPLDAPDRADTSS